jgi:hypothetical protein
MSKPAEVLKSFLTKNAQRMAHALSKDGFNTSIQARYRAVEARIEAGTYCACELCEGPMPLIITDKKHFLSTTCSDACEQALALEKEEEAEEKITGRSFNKKYEEDLLPKHLQISTTLNVRQYGGAKVRIIRADIAEVENLGKHAMVEIDHEHVHVPLVVRIAAFADGEQSAIIKSLVEEISISEAKKAILQDFMQRAATARYGCGVDSMTN